MRSVKFLVAAGAASLLSSAAFAADMPPSRRRRCYTRRPRSGFRRLVSARRYRLQQSEREERLLDPTALPTTTWPSLRPASFVRGGIFGVGVGYQFNNWFRADVTGEYRGNVQFHRHSMSSTQPARSPALSAGRLYRDQVRTALPGQRLCRSRHLVVRHAVHRCRRRYCAGIDQAFTDTGVTSLTRWHSGTPASTIAARRSQWNFAWAVHAGLAYRVSPDLTLELAYSYINLGNGMTGPTSSFDQVTNTSHAPF